MRIERRVLLKKKQKAKGPTGDQISAVLERVLALDCVGGWGVAGGAIAGHGGAAVPKSFNLQF